MSRNDWCARVNPVLVDTPAGIATAAAALAPCTLLGLDTETKPQFKRAAPPSAPALLQVAGMRSRTCPVPTTVYLFDLQALLPAHGAALSSALAAPLADPGTTLLGVGLCDDLLDLSHFHGGSCAAFARRATSPLEKENQSAQPTSFWVRRRVVPGTSARRTTTASKCPVWLR